MSAPMLRDVREVIREEMTMHEPILAALGHESLSVPQVAERIGKPSSETLCWLMGMRRYGLVIEDGDADDDGYFHYKAVTR